jgi:hypothetical protein
MMMCLVSLGLVAVGAIIAVVVLMAGSKQDDPVMTSTSGTAILTSTSSTTMPKINTVSEKTD